jgi:hypothetical protein
MSYTTIGDIIIQIDIVEDNLVFDIIEDNINVKLIEDHIDVNVVEESFNIDLKEDVFSIDLIEDHIDVSLDDGCICLPSSNGNISSTEIYNCNGNLIIGDLVYQSSAIEKYVIKTIDNKSVNPIIGIVTKILSANTVEVSHLGFFNVNAVLNPGQKVYVSTSGTFSSIVPDYNYIQVLGVAITNSRLYLNPEIRRCCRLIL